ncbi:isopentenyl-diphosphate Delta-isomerase [Candidatus Parcubacteria bacterium]|nr:isopentenyl-diphosphate Delta-isomerase [Candidatus Parcubacteria bacterium]
MVHRADSHHDIILVDERDRQIGTAGKMTPHRTGALHRAFSVFVFNSRGELLLQKRAKKKYHSAGLWTNTCCSHPRPGEATLAAARRRLKEEMGFTTKLREVFSFIYRVKFANGLMEHEYDHVLVGRFGGAPRPDPVEAEDWEWVSLPQLRHDIRRHPRRYSFWLKKVLPRFTAHLTCNRHRAEGRRCTIF